MGPITEMNVKPSNDSVTISRALATKEVRSATNQAEKAVMLIQDFNVQKSSTLKTKVCSRSARKRAIKATRLGHRIGVPGNRHRLTVADEDSIAQYITMLIKERVPVFLENITSLVCSYI